MKRISTVIVVLLAVLLVVPNAKAQEQNYEYAHQKGLTIGVTGSGVLTGIVTQPSWGQANHNHRMRIGVNYGLDLGYQFSHHFSASVGVAMLNLGTTLNNKAYYFEEFDKVLNEDRTIDLSYLSIPVMLHYVDNRRTFNFVGGVGVSYGILLSADQKWQLEDKTTGAITDYYALVEVDGEKINVAEKDVKDRFNSGDIMINTEAGVRLCATEKLNFDLLTTYNWSLASATKTKWNDVPNFQPKDYWSHKPRNVFGGFKLNIVYKFGNRNEE